MIELNLTAATPEHIILKDYLENNVSDVLADKINNGVRIEKDGKTLVNKKDLAGFMKYACEEARKQAGKASSTPCARYACIEDKAVFGWCLHYFEEDTIEGALYNVDGTEYKPPRPAVNTAYKPAPVIVKPKPQVSMFDFGGQAETAAVETDEDFTDESEFDDTDAQDENEPDYEQENETPPGLIHIGENKYVDNDGVVYSNAEAEAKKSIPDALYELAGCAFKMGVKP